MASFRVLQPGKSELICCLILTADAYNAVSVPGPSDTSIWFSSSASGVREQPNGGDDLLDYVGLGGKMYAIAISLAQNPTNYLKNTPGDTELRR
jgi:hypothetical protein